MTDFDFIRPSFLEGVARLADWWGALGARPGGRTDAEVLEDDWRAVGDDMRKVLGWGDRSGGAR